MADLSNLQTASMAAPTGQLQGVSGITVQEQSPMEQLGGLAKNVFQGTMGAFATGQKNEAARIKQEKEDQFQTDLGNYATALHTIQTRYTGKELNTKVSKLNRDFLSKHPARSEDFVEFNQTITGEKYADKSAEQKSYEKGVNEMWDAGMGDNTQPMESEFNTRSYRQFRESQAESQRGKWRSEEIDLLVKENQLTETQAKDAKLKNLSEMVPGARREVQLEVEKLMGFIQADPSAENIAAQVQKLERMKLDYMNEFSNVSDPSMKDEIETRMSTVFSEIDYGLKLLNGDIEKSAYDSFIALQEAEGVAKVYSNNPRAAGTIAIINKLPDSVAGKIAASKVAVEVIESLITTESVSGKTGRKTVDPKSPTENPDVQQQVVETVKSQLIDADPVKQQAGRDQISAIVKGLRNGEDYSEAQLMNVAQIANIEGALDHLSPEEKKVFEDRLAQYFEDVARTEVNNAMSAVDLRIPTTNARGDLVYDRESGFVGDYFRLEYTDAGARMRPVQGVQMNATLRKVMNDRNMGLAKVDDALQLVAREQGITIEEAATQFFGMPNVLQETPEGQTEQAPNVVPRGQRDEMAQYGMTAPKQTQYAAAPEDMGGQAERMKQWYQETLVEPSRGVYQGNEETAAERRQMPVASRWADLADSLQQQGFGDLASSLRMEGRRKDLKETGETQLGTGTVLSQHTIDELKVTEGTGDTVTGIPTGHYGVTKGALDATGRKGVDPKSLSPEEAEKVVVEYMEVLDEDFTSNMKGYDQLPNEAKLAILDAGYNMGPKVKNFPKLKKAVEAGDATEAMKQLLDTAQESGKSMRGLAKRRAENYNAVADDPITEIEQFEDRLDYRDADGNVVFSFKKPRHPKSALGVIKL